MDSDHAMQLCIKELEMVQNNIARFDQNGMTIKSWCITLWSALMAYSLQNNDPRISLIGIVIVLGFAFNELIYRGFQGRFIERSGEIERGLRAGDMTAYRFSINTAAGLRVKRGLWRAMSRPHFWIFYAMFLLFSIGVYVYLAAR